MLRFLACRATVSVLVIAVALPVAAQLPPDVLVRGPGITLTRSDFDAELTRVPAEHRFAFTTQPQRVQTMLNNVLVNRTLAERARSLGLDKDPIVQRRIALEAERVLAGLMIDRIEADAGAEFDRNAERNLARARELYLINRGKYVIAEEVDVSHILFDTSKRGKDEALAAAKDARAKLAAGADFAALAVAVSDDPTASGNKGRLGSNPRGRFEPPFEVASFALKNPGDLSEVVLTRYGYHVIRLEARKPERTPSFDEVRETILTDMRQKQVNDARESAIAAIRSDKALVVNQQAVEALVTKAEVPPLPPAVLPGGAEPAKPQQSAPAPSPTPR